MDVSILVQALPYIRAFRDKTFVVKLGGELLRDRPHLEAIAGDLTLLSLVGIRLIAVHGGGPQANELSKLLGFEPQIVRGRRVTDERALEVAKMVFAGTMNVDVLGALRKHGGKGVGLSGVDAGMVRARRRPVTRVLNERTGELEDVDFGFVGDVVSVETDLVAALVARGYIPVVASLAADEDGTILNVNADTIAAEIAIAARAEKLILMANVPGVYKDFAARTDIHSTLDPAEARALEKTVGGGMGPKLAACARAVEAGVREAHIIDGLAPHALLAEVFTDRGVGTRIAAKDAVAGAATAIT